MDKIVYDNFPETEELIDKTYVEECCNRNISVDEIFFSINNGCYVVRRLVVMRHY